MPVIPETGVMGKNKTVIQIVLNISKVSRNHEKTHELYDSGNNGAQLSFGREVS